MSENKPFEKKVDIAKQKVMTEMAKSSRKTNVTVGSPYVITARPSPSFTWKKMAMISTEMSMKTLNLKNHEVQCNQPFIPISFIDS